MSHDPNIDQLSNSYNL